MKHALSILGLLLAITVSAQATNASASLAELPHWPIGLQLPAALGGQPPAKGPVKAKTLCNRDAAS